MHYGHNTCIMAIIHVLWPYYMYYGYNNMGVWGSRNPCFHDDSHTHDCLQFSWLHAYRLCLVPSCMHFAFLWCITCMYLYTSILPCMAQHCFDIVLCVRTHLQRSSIAMTWESEAQEPKQKHVFSKKNQRCPDTHRITMQNHCVFPKKTKTPKFSRTVARRSCPDSLAIVRAIFH